MKGFTYDYAPEEAKEGPHLAVYTSNGFAIPVVPERGGHGGSPLWYVEDASQQGKVFPLFLRHLSRKEWVLRCACGKEGCTQEWVLKVKVRGRHPLPDAVVTER